MRAQQGCRAGVEPPGLRELQDLPIPNTPGPAWRALSIHRVLQQWPCPRPSQQESCSEGFLGHKTRQKCIFFTLWKPCKNKPSIGDPGAVHRCVWKGRRENRELQGGEGTGMFLLSLCACLALSFSALKKGLEFSKMRKKKKRNPNQLPMNSCAIPL